MVLLTLACAQRRVEACAHLLPNGQAHGWVGQLAARLQRGRAQPHEQNAHLHALHDTVRTHPEAPDARLQPRA